MLSMPKRQFKTSSKLFEGILRGIGYVSLLLLVLIMLFSPYLQDKIIHIDVTVLLGIVVGNLLGFVVYFDSKLTAIQKARQEVSHNQISDGIKDVIAQNRFHVKCLRIKAWTSEAIFPVIREVQCNIDECFVLLHHFDEDAGTKTADKLNAKVSYMIEAWRELESSGKIGVLRIKRTDDIPSNYVIIIDDKALVTGLYVPDDKSPYGHEFFEPVVFVNKTQPMGELIRKYVAWFDRIFEYYS